MKRRSLLRAALFCGGGALALVLPIAADAIPSDAEAETIERLIARVDAMKDAVFIHNGKGASAHAAAVHLRKKYQRFLGEIRTAEDFIRLCATRSEASKQPYKVRLRSGKERLAADLLLEELQALRSGRAR